MGKILIKELADQKEARLKDAYRKAQNALEQFAELSDFSCSSIEDLDATKVKNFVQSNINAIRSAQIFTEYRKQELIHEWREKQASAIALIRVIENLFNECQGYTFSIQDGEIICEMPLRAIAEALSYRDVPEQAEEHFKLIETARDAIRQLREFETAQDLRRTRTCDFSIVTMEKVAEWWASGSIKIDHTYDQLLERAAVKGNIIFGRD